MAPPIQFQMAPRMRQDAGAAKKRSKHGRCPYGCKQGAGDDENGYCRHLLGWIDAAAEAGKKNAVTVRVLKHIGNPEHASAVESVDVYSDTVKKTDRIVAMPVGLPCRVYRYDADAPKGADLPPQPELPPDPLTVEQLEDQARDKELVALRAKLDERDKQFETMQRQLAELMKAKQGGTNK